MSRKIFTAIWGAALAVFAASLVFIMGVSYNYFTGVQMKQLHAETALAAQGVSLCGKDYFTGLSTGDYRVTWIDADGTVQLWGSAEKPVLMGHEADSFARYIADPAGSRGEYEENSRLAREVARCIAEIRRLAGIRFPSDPILKSD